MSDPLYNPTRYPQETRVHDPSPDHPSTDLLGPTTSAVCQHNVIRRRETWGDGREPGSAWVCNACPTRFVPEASLRELVEQTATSIIERVGADVAGQVLGIDHRHVGHFAEEPTPFDSTVEHRHIGGEVDHDHDDGRSEWSLAEPDSEPEPEPIEPILCGRCRQPRAIHLFDPGNGPCIRAELDDGYGRPVYCRPEDVPASTITAAELQRRPIGEIL